MRIVLLKDIKKLGRAGEVVEVADGFARNLLIPKGLARFADEQTISEIKSKLEALASKQEKGIAAARELAQKLNGAEFEFSLPASPSGRLYASLKESDILDKIRKKYPQLPIQTKLIDPTPIKSAGSHEVKLELVLGVTTVVKLVINPVDAKESK